MLRRVVCLAWMAGASLCVPRGLPQGPPPEYEEEPTPVVPTIGGATPSDAGVEASQPLTTRPEAGASEVPRP
jgi:hypothetical protein